MSELFTPFESQLVTVAAGALAEPTTSSDGGDISAWRSNSRLKTMRAVVYLYGTAATLSDVILWGYRYDRWHYLGKLNSGENIPIASDTKGYAEVVGFIGIFERLAVSATGGVTITQEFEPGEVTG
jgi:hypothetical protein